jgi:hypothetical protein
MRMRVILFIVVALALVGVLVADGVNLYGAHRNAVNFSDRAAELAVQTYVDTGGSEDAVHKVIQDMAVAEGVELVDLSYHKGTTRWYEVTVRAAGSTYLLGYLPFVKNRLAQQSRAVAHF